MLSAVTRNFTATPGCCDSVYDEAGKVIETHEHAGNFKEAWCFPAGHKRNHELVNVAGAFQLSEEVSGAFTASFPRRVFGSADHSGADRTSDRVGAAQE